MKKIILAWLLFTYSIFSFSHSLAMGDFSMEMTNIEIQKIDHCCEEETKSHESNICGAYGEVSFYGVPKDEIFLKIFYSNPFEYFSFFLPQREYKIISGNISPPYMYRDIKNYSYSTLSGIIKNIA